MLLCNQAFELKQEADVDIAYFRLERKNEKRVMQLSSLCKAKLIFVLYFFGELKHCSKIPKTQKKFFSFRPAENKHYSICTSNLLPISAFILFFIFFFAFPNSKEFKSLPSDYHWIESPLPLNESCLSYSKLMLLLKSRNYYSSFQKSWTYNDNYQPVSIQPIIPNIFERITYSQLSVK